MTNPANSRTTAHGRTYEWGDEVFDSVTTILSGGVPKGFLAPWRAKLAAEAAVNERETWAPMARADAIDWIKKASDRVSEPAADLGSEVHDWAEKYMLGEAIPEPSGQIVKFCEQFKKFVADWEPKYEATEVTVYSREYGYAGTLDALLWIDGRLYLVDYKTGKAVYPEAALQLAAYRNAEFMGLPDGTEAPVPDVYGCIVLHLRHQKYEVIPVQAGKEQFRYFLFARRIREFVRNGDSFLGQPVLPGEADPFTVPLEEAAAS